MTPVVKQVRSRRLRRLIPVGVLALAGVVAVMTGLFPALGAELIELAKQDPRGGLVLTGRVASVELGIVLLVLSWWLSRGSRAAWMLAVATTVATAVLGLARGHIGLSTLTAAAALLLLLCTQGAFRLRGHSAPRRRWWIPAGVGIGLLGFALAGYAEIDQIAPASTGSRLTVIGRTIFFLPGGIDLEQRLIEGYVFALRTGFVLLIVAVLWALRPKVAGEGGDRDHVRAFARQYGTTSTAPLLALPDNQLLELDEARAWAAVGIRSGTAVSLGAPVAQPGREDCALEEFTAFCEQNGWTPALLALDTTQKDLAAAAGYASTQIGVEAILDVADFSTAGKRRSNIRHSVSRARREEVTVLSYDTTHRTPQRTEQLADVSAQWLQDKGGPELGFTLGRFDAERLDDQEVYIAIHAIDTPAERVVAFVTWLPYNDGKDAVLDLMRRARDCPPGVMELLIVDSLADFSTSGRAAASLGGVPLARDPSAAEEGPQDRAQRALGWVYEHGGEVYDARGLFRFKDKFAPRWEPMFLAYPGPADLPRIALAAARAFLPPNTLREIVRARRAAAVAAKSAS